MRKWLTSMNQKRHQRAINRLVRDLNKNLEQDDLWLGRFMVRQIESPQWIRYEDGSGAELYITLEFVDRCTGRYYRMCESVNHWRLWGGSCLWRAMNDFIVERCDVWSEKLAHERNYDAWREYNKRVRIC